MKIEQLPTGEKTYKTIYLDPPWSYSRKNPDRKSLDEIYTGGTMPIEVLERLPVRSLGDPDGFYLWMWITWPKLRDDYHRRLFSAWGLEWKSELVWDKEIFGMGYYLRLQTEVLLLATSAPKMRLARNDQRDVLRLKRSQEHSAKPPEARAIIETLTPGPYLEMFARENVEGWDTWGLEVAEQEVKQA